MMTIPDYQRSRLPEPPPMIPSRLRPALFVAFAALLGGCNSLEGLLPTGQNQPVPPGQQSQRSLEGVQNHQGPGSDAEKIKVTPLQTTDLGCPAVDIADGAATQRVGGEANSSVRYQFSIDNVSRNCEPRGSQAAINIGVAGQVLIGPAGSPGNFATDVKVVVASLADKKTVYQKVYKVAVNTGGAAQGPFQLVMDPILVPLTRTDLDGVYSITVGLGNSVAARARKGQ